MNLARQVGPLSIACLGLLSAWIGFEDPITHAQVQVPVQAVEFAIKPVPADQSKEHAPLRVESVDLGGHHGPLGSVKVYNDSRKVVIAYTVGWSFRDTVPGPLGWQRAGNKNLGGFVGPSVSTNLGPKKKEKTDQKEKAAELFHSEFPQGLPEGFWLMVVGVSEVVFEDGTRWSADPATFYPKS